jgi:long-chain acyl-CoA synthetase
MNVAQLAVDAVDRFGEYASSFFDGQWHSNRLLLERARSLATVLREHEIEPGDRVVVMMLSCLEVPAAFHALAQIGAVSVPVMPQLIPSEINYIVEHSGAKTVLTSPEIAARVCEATADIDGFRQVLVFGESDVPDCQNITPVVDSAEPMQEMFERADDDLAVLVYTSGTTGNPKGVMLSHKNLVSNTKSVAALFDRPIDERSMMCLPMSHVYGILLMNLGALIGGKGTMLRWFDPTKALETIESFRVESCSLVPSMLVALITHPDREKYDVSSLKRVTAGSAPLANELRLEFERLFECRVVDGYGQSEATCALTAYHDDEQFVPGSAGRAIPDMELCVQNDANEILGVGETGEICARGDSVMLGYWNNEEATRSAIVDGWLHTGDVGHLDQRGYLFITDRKKDLIIKGGENISPRGIEEVIRELPEIAEVTVYGVPDERFQEEIAAAIVMKPDCQVSEDRVREFAAGRMSKFKIPKYVLFKEALPKNSNGKVLKRKLREEWSG